MVCLPADRSVVAGVPTSLDYVMSRRVARSTVHQPQRDVRSRARIVSLGVGQAGGGYGQRYRSGSEQRGSRAEGAENA